MRIKRLVFLLSFAAPAFAQVNVPIQNPSFETLPNATATVGPCFDYIRASSSVAFPGWQVTYSDPIWGGVEIFKPFASNPCLMPVPPDGSWILFVGSSTVSQDTGITPSDFQSTVGDHDGVYQITFWVANNDTVYPGYYEVAITFGTIDPITHVVKGHEFCSVDGWAKWHFTEVSYPCPSPDYLLGEWPDGSGKADPNAHIIISLSHTKGWPLLFDKVYLTFTPTN